MKLRVTKPNLYDAQGQRKAVGDIITVEGKTIPRVYAGKVEPVNEQGLTTDQDAGGDVAELQAENEGLKQEVERLSNENDELRAENGQWRLKANGEFESQGESSDQDDSGDTSAEADAKRKAWLIDEIEKLTGDRPGSNSKLETLEKKFEEAKLAGE